MSELKLFIPLTKVDVAKRLVYGTAAEEILDRGGEIFDYAASKPNIMAWSDDFKKLTDGESLGNLRAMHANISAGKLTEIHFDDEGKKIEVCCKVVDDNEWNKVQECVYTGFSFGGKYGKRWQDAQGAKRYEAIPNELSLGDRPAIPTATFTLVKIDGTEEQVPFAKVENTAVEDGAAGLTAKIAELGLTEDQAQQALLFLVDNAGYEAVMNPLNPLNEKMLAKRDFSASERKSAAKSGAAMPDGSFPIEHEEDLKNAIKAYGRAKDKDAAKAHIKKRAKALKLAKLLPDEWSSGEKAEKLDKISSAEDLKKYLGEEAWDVRSALYALEYLYGLYSGESQPDEPPEQAKDLAAAIMHIKSFIQSEIQEKDEDDPNMALNAGATDLAKTGATISAANKKHVQAIHDHACNLGADCSGMEKIAGLGSGADAGSLAKIAGLEGDLAKIVTERDGLLAEVERLKAEPEAPKGPIIDLSKLFTADKDSEGTLAKTAPAEDPEKTPTESIKDVHRRGGRFIRF